MVHKISGVGVETETSPPMSLLCRTHWRSLVPGFLSSRSVSTPDFLAKSLQPGQHYCQVCHALANCCQLSGGGAAGSDCKSCRTLSLSHVTLSKLGEWDFTDLGRFAGGVGSKYCLFCFLWYALIDSSSVSTAIAAARSAWFYWSRHLR